MAKFFFAAAVWGRLRLRDVPDRGAWDRRQIAYWDETYLDSISRLADMGHKVHAAAELDDVIAASRRVPGIRTLWIHEDLLDHAERRWVEAQEPVQAQTMAARTMPPRTARPRTAKARWRAPALAAAALAAAFLVGLISSVVGPLRPVLSPGRNHEAAPVLSTPSKLPAYTLVKTIAAVKTVAAGVARSAATTSTLAASQIARARAKAAYAVSVGTFESVAAAERMRHLVLSKGYVVVIVRHGAASQVVTPPYRTRAEAERVERGLEASGIREEIVTFRAR